MHLRDSQAQRLYQLLDFMTCFAAGRYNLCGPERLARIAAGMGDPDLSFEALGMVWDDPTAIDDLLATKPKTISAADLRVIEGFKDCLWGPQLLVGFDASGRALFSVGDQTVAVVGLSQEISTMVSGPLPQFVEVALLPFEGVVTYGESFSVPNLSFGPGLRKSMAEEAAAALAREPICAAGPFRELARKQKERKRTDEEKRFADRVKRERWEAEGNEPLPPEVRRGSLAGLSEGERRERVKAGDEELARVFRQRYLQELRRHAGKGEPVLDTPAALTALSKADLEGFARLLGAKGLSKLNKKQLADVVEPLLDGASGLLADDLASCDDLQYSTVLELSRTSGHIVSVGEGDFLRDGAKYKELVPWTRLYRAGDGIAVVLPDYAREALAGVDLPRVEAERDFCAKVFRLADILVDFCGVVRLPDFAERFRSFYGSDRSDQEILEKLNDVVLDHGDDSPFEFWRPWTADGGSVERADEPEALIHFTLCDELIVRGALAAGAAEPLNGIGQFGSEAFPKGLEGDELLKRAKEALLRRDERVRALLGEHEAKRKDGPCPLDPALKTEEVYTWRGKTPEVVSLRNWLDAHVPEGEDDLRFADRCVERILEAHTGAQMPTALVRAADDMDLFLLSEDHEALTGRLMALWSALPNWDNNGWSPDALHAKVTGRRVFRNPDGTERKVGRNEPCPCGSGKKYKRCCGR